MVCVECRQKIDVQQEDFEEVGPKEFMHTKCLDKLLEQKSWSGEEDRATMNSETASKSW